MTADTRKPKRFYFTTARVCSREDLLEQAKRVEQLIDLFNQDLVLIGKDGTELLRCPCGAFASSSVTSASDIGRAIEPDDVATIQLPLGLTVIFDARLEYEDQAEDEEFIMPIWFHGAGEPVDFTFPGAP